MVTVIKNYSPWQSLGQSAGEGASEVLKNQTQFSLNQGRLKEGLKKLYEPGFENQNIYQQLYSIAPELLSIPGGAQLLGELAPIFQRQSQSNAYANYLNNKNGNANQGGNAPMNPNQDVVKPEGTDYFANPIPPRGPEATRPSRTTAQPVQEFTPEMIEKRKIALAEESRASGKPLSPAEIDNIVMSEARQAENYNNRIMTQQKNQQEFQNNRVAALTKRFENTYPESSESDRSVFNKFVNEAKDAENDNDAYLYANSRYDKYQTAKSGIERQASIPGPVDTLMRKLNGSYKDKNQIIEGLQPNIKTLMDLGLYPETKDLLVNNVGLGPEDAERAIFPFTKQEKKSIDSIPKNPNWKPLKKFSTPHGGAVENFPGESASLPPEKYQDFKEEMLNLLQKNPAINLLGLRGDLMEKQGYYWEDIFKSVSELLQEGRFKPNDYQFSQLNILREPPIPGLANQFKFLFKGTK